MPNANVRQAGFGSIGIVAIILVVATLVGVGFVVLNKESKQQAAVTPSVTNHTVKTPVEETPSKPAAEQSYVLEIKEWSVASPYDSDSGSKLTYKLSDDEVTAYLTSASLTDESEPCQSGAGIVQRFKGSDTDISGNTIADAALRNPGRYVVVEGNYYQYMHAQAACGLVSAADQNKVNDLAKQAIAKLEPVRR